MAKGKYSSTIKKLHNAINNQFDKKLLINKTQFYSEKSQKVIEMIVIKQAVWDEQKGRYINIELYKSCSDINILLYLRDMWYNLNGWEVPKDTAQLTKQDR